MIATLTPGRAKRVVKRTRLDFSNVRDHRQKTNRNYPLAGLLNIMVAGIVAGKQKLRQTEAFAKDITGNIRRFFGIAGKENPSDTTLYNLAKNLNPEGMEKTLKSQIKQGLQTKAIRNDDFAIGAISIDGKGAGGAKGQAPNEVCHQTVCDKEGSAAWYLYALRACLISALAKPIIGNVYIPNKGGESTYFGPLLRSLVKSYSKLFQIVMVDAGMTSQGNAKLVLGLGKWYVMAVKGNQPTLHSLAKEALKNQEVVATTTEKYQGNIVKRELCRVPCPSDCHFAGAKQFWLVRQTIIEPKDKAKKKEKKKKSEKNCEERIFVTAIPWDTLKDAQILKLVRLHWTIENNANWTLDVILYEDKSCPCKKGNGIIVYSWLKVLSYNLLSIFRCHLPTHDNGQMTPWDRCMSLVHQAMCIVQGLEVVQEK